VCLFLTDSPGPTEDERVLHGHQGSKLGTLGVVVLAAVLAPWRRRRRRRRRRRKQHKTR